MFSNAKVHRGPIAQAVLDNDAQRELLRDKSVAGDMTQEDWRSLRPLIADRKLLCQAAESMCHRSIGDGNQSR